MANHPLAGKPAPAAMLANIPRLVTAYFSERPDPTDAAQRVTFGTSGHRGSALKGSFNEAHILAVTQAICDFRKKEGIDGPLFLGMDTHALSEPAFATALEVLAGTGVETMIAHDGGYTPTPAISHAILNYNRGRTTGLADGIVITPSHNPPEDGGIKYTPRMAARRRLRSRPRSNRYRTDCSRTCLRKSPASRWVRRVKLPRRIATISSTPMPPI